VIRTVEEQVVLGDLSFNLVRPENSDALISEPEYLIDERLPYWADLWPSAHILAARVLEETPARGKAIELGCGLGLVTIASLHAGYQVLATDYYLDALDFTRENVRRAAVAPDATSRFATQLLDWNSPPPLDAFDLALAADVLYERRYGPVVADMLAHALGPAGKAIVADPGRVGVEDFKAALPDFGLRVTDEEVRPYTDGRVHQRITLYTICH
jgi:predicted nicotinamide N-methyase